MTFPQKMRLRRTLRRIVKQCQSSFAGGLVILGNDGLVGPDAAWTGIVERKGPRWLGRIPRPTRQPVLIVETDLHGGSARCTCFVPSVRPVAKMELNKFTNTTGITVKV